MCGQETRAKQNIFYIFSYFFQAIADILDAYSRVGCSSPESVDELVEKVPEAAADFEPEALAKLIVAAVRLG